MLIGTRIGFGQTMALEACFKSSCLPYTSSEFPDPLVAIGAYLAQRGDVWNAEVGEAVTIPYLICLIKQIPEWAVTVKDSHKREILVALDQLMRLLLERGDVLRETYNAYGCVPSIVGEFPLFVARATVVQAARELAKITPISDFNPRALAVEIAEIALREAREEVTVIEACKTVRELARTPDVEANKLITTFTAVEMAAGQTAQYDETSAPNEYTQAAIDYAKETLAVVQNRWPASAPPDDGTPGQQPPTPIKPLPETPPAPFEPASGMPLGAKIAVTVSVALALGVIGYIVLGRSEPAVQFRRRTA